MLGKRYTQIRTVVHTLPDGLELLYFGYVEFDEQGEIIDVASLDYVYEDVEECALIAEGIQQALDMPNVCIQQTVDSYH